MADMIWTKYVVRATREPNPKFPGRIIAGLTLEMWGDDTSEPENVARLEYRKFPASEVGILDSKLGDAGRKLTKLGFVQTGPLEFTATNIPDGKTRKAHKLFVKGLDELVELGDERAVKKGRSSHKDWDDDGNKKGSPNVPTKPGK